MQSALSEIGIGSALRDPIVSVGTIAIAVALALIAHAVLARILHRIVARTRSNSDDIVVAEASQPMRWIFVALALTAVQRAIPLASWAADLWTRVAGLVVPALLGWLALAMLRAFRLSVQLKTDISVADNLSARRRRTRMAILGRIGAFAILFVTVCLMLLSLPGVRSVGVTLMASAGLAGLAVGAAAQPALRNLIAGLQMAFTEPIRIDDVVIIAGEWGRIEDIRLTYVVVKVWDERRLIVPVAKFLEEPFQNWTRDTSQLLGTAFLYLDPTADVARLRAKLAEVVKGDPNWDGRVVGLQVTDLKETVMELRALVSAADASRAFDLRCDVRERMMAFVTSEAPEWLPRQRAEIQAAAPTGG